jgi:hypothetical protein
MIWMRYVARVLSLIWAGWWVFFGVASGIDERGKPIEILLHAAAPGLVFLVSALVAWRWETVGAVLLLLEGLLVLIGYPLMVHGRFSLWTIVFVELTMALPPLVSGVLFLIASQMTAKAAHP